MNRFKSVLITVGIVLSSPLVASWMVKVVPNVSVTANRLANTTIGETVEDVTIAELDAPLDTNTTNNLLDNVISSGLGWDYSNKNEESEEDFFSDTTANTGDKPYPDPDTLTNHSGEVIQTVFNGYSGEPYLELSSGAMVKNVTSIDNSVLLEESTKSPEFTVELYSEEPQVLIMHTHTTESFEPFKRTYYDDSFNYRTTDSSKNVVMIGDAIAKQLEDANINTIHDTTIHDYPSYTGSYERSAVTVQSILDEYPSIKVVLDIHRDALSRDGNLLQPIVEVDGKESAQIMIVSGCDDGTMNMPNYLQNFRLASLIQNQLYSDYGDVARPILFDYRKYNQDLTTGSLLVEVGTHGNTLQQVQYAGELFGKSLAKALSN